MSNRSKRFNYKHFIRRAHRYLGVFIGIQFILWTLGGLYFSWTDLNEIHGDHLRAHQHVEMSIPAGSVPPDQIVQTVQSKIGVARIEKIYIVELLGEYFYAVEHVNDKKPSTVLVSVKDGSVRPEVSSAEAGRIAQEALANPSEPAELTYLTADNVHYHLGNSFLRITSAYTSARKPVSSELAHSNTWQAFDCRFERQRCCQSSGPFEPRFAAGAIVITIL